MNLKDKTVLITGGTSGIGLAIAKGFATDGSRLILNYTHNDERANKVLKELSKITSVELIKADISDEKEVDEMFEVIKLKFGNIDILINNVGNVFGDDPLDLKGWQDTFSLNVFGTVNVTKHAIDMMSEGSKVVNITSYNGWFNYGWSASPAYSASKAALNSFTVTMNKIYAPKIIFNGVAPAYTETAMWDTVSKEEREMCENSTLTKRLINPKEIANTVLFITQNDAIIGQIITVDAGIPVNLLKTT